MQIISGWPSADRLTLPPPVFEQLMEQLIEPFGDAETAQDFWLDEGCTLLYFTHGDNVDELVDQGVLNGEVMDHAFHFPDISEELEGGYLLNLAITSDSGGGTYVLLHPSFPAPPLAGGDDA